MAFLHPLGFTRQSSVWLLESPEHPLDNEAALHSAMVETKGVLTARERRLLSEWNEAEAQNDLVAMEEIENLLVEVRGLRYNA